MRDQFSISHEGPFEEDLVNRANRQQVGTDIGRIAQTLINSAIMQPNYAFSDEKTLYEDTGQVRKLANLLSEVHIGPEMVRREGDGYERYHEAIPDDIHILTNEAGMMIAMLTDALVATKFHTPEQREEMLNSLIKIGELVKKFNQEANSMHTTAQITIVEKEKNEDEKHL